MSASPNYMSALLNSGTGIYGLYNNSQRGGVQGLQGALGSASKAANGIGGLFAPGAAQGAIGQASGYLGGAGNAAGVVGGIQQGGVGGYGSAAINAGNLAGRTGALGQSTSGLNQGVGDASNALAIYNGIKQGGVGGYGNAAVNAAQLAGRTGALGQASGAVAQGAGYLAAPLALYGAIKGYQSGDTGGDAVRGAQAGAAIGSIVPGVGTAIGAVLGGALGAISSAFGNGKVDPENQSFQGFTQAYHQDPSGALAQNSDPYLPLAGLFDLRSNQIKGEIPFYNKYGRMGEQAFTNDMMKQIDAAKTAGTINANSTPQEVYATAVAPWINKMGTWQDSNKDAIQADLTQMAGQYNAGDVSSWKAIGGDNTFMKQPSPTAQAVAANSQVPKSAHSKLTMAAKGGKMSGRRRKSALAQVYDGSFTSRQGFDDGGSAYLDYYSPTAGNVGGYDPTPVMQDFGNLGTGVSDTSNPFSGINQSVGDEGNYVNAGNNPLAYGLNPSGGTSPTPTSLAGNATGAGGLAGLLKTYAPLIPLITSAIGANKAKPPSAPPGMTNGASAMPAPQFNRQATNPQMSQADWYTYGQRPETSFFSNNRVPLVGSGPSAVAPAPTVQAGASPTTYAQPGQMTNLNTLTGSTMAKGGALSQAGSYAEPDGYEGEFDSSMQQHVRGPGDGTSDDIPAKLSDGEYVFDAGSVSMLGNGSNDAGARALDELRANLRKHVGKKLVKGKQFMKAKPPAAYLPGKSGSKAGE